MKMIRIERWLFRNNEGMFHLLLHKFPVMSVSLVFHNLRKHFCVGSAYGEIWEIYKRVCVCENESKNFPFPYITSAYLKLPGCKG